jgi:hypothetical protein
MSVETYRVRRGRLRIGDGLRTPGDLVPEAHTWWRREAYVRQGLLEKVEVDDGELMAAVEQYMPDSELASALKSVAASREREP